MDAYTLPNMLDDRVKLHWRRTKIVATLGPATSTPKAIAELLEAGVDVVRLNMSHGDHASHRALFALVRKTAQKLDRHVGILLDLCGPKIRTGTFPGGAITLLTNTEVVIDTRADVGAPGVIASQYRLLHKDVKAGQRVLLDDGNLELRVLGVRGQQVRCRVIYGGILKDHKGINLPDSTVTAPALTAKDRDDARLAVELGADFVAMSFVRNAQNVLALKRLLAKLAAAPGAVAVASIPVIAKIETPEAIHNIHKILRVSDGIMVARGDLGIELPAETVPLVQRDLIKLAREYHVPVIVATQMLESMITQARPTRAEVGDVANAAFAGADAVMLSAETASGKYPLRAIKIMDKVVREVEGYQWQQGAFVLNGSNKKTLSDRDAIAHAAASLAHELKLQGLIIPSNSGITARIIAAQRPTAPLIAVSRNAAVCRQMALCWGIVPMIYTPNGDSIESEKMCREVAARAHLTRTGQNVLLVSGFNDDPLQNSPMMRLVRV